MVFIKLLRPLFSVHLAELTRKLGIKSLYLALAPVIGLVILNELIRLVSRPIQPEIRIVWRWLLGLLGAFFTWAVTHYYISKFKINCFL